MAKKNNIISSFRNTAGFLGIGESEVTMLYVLPLITQIVLQLRY